MFSKTSAAKGFVRLCAGRGDGGNCGRRRDGKTALTCRQGAGDGGDDACRHVLSWLASNRSSDGWAARLLKGL